MNDYIWDIKQIPDSSNLFFISNYKFILCLKEECNFKLLLKVFSKILN